MSEAIRPLILLTGAHGAVARHLLRLLTATGHPVRVASRRPAAPPVPAVACDLGVPAGVVAVGNPARVVRTL